MNHSATVATFDDIADLIQDRRYQFWVLQFLGWLGWVTLFAIRDIYWSQAFERIPLLLIDAVAGFLLTSLLRLFYQTIWDKSIFIRIVGILIGSFLMAIIWQPIKNFFQFYYYDDFSALEKHGDLAYFNGLYAYSYFLILGWSGLYYGLKFYRLLQEEKQKSIKAELMAQEAQLRMLRYQLNPHFLFNTLNAISTLTLEKDGVKANQMVTKLSHFLRYSLDNDPIQKVDLDTETNTMKLYLEIEQVRFGDRLTIEFDIEPRAAQAQVPSLLLQPLVENAIKHAIAPRIDGGKIIIRARLFGIYLVLDVIDDGPGFDIESFDVKEGERSVFSGVGLNNTMDRLRTLYGKNQSCKFQAVLPKGMKVEIRIPHGLPLD